MTIANLRTDLLILAQPSRHWEQESLTALKEKVHEKQSQAKPFFSKGLEL